jgi:hypothetical protein
MHNQMVTPNLPEGIKTEVIFHNGEKRIKLLLDYNDMLIKQVKNLPGRRWSQTIGCWHIPYTDDYMNYLIEFFNDKKLQVEIIDRQQTVKRIYKEKKAIPGIINTKQGNRILLEYKQIMKLKRLSHLTQQVYFIFFSEFVEANTGT